MDELLIALCAGHGENTYPETGSKGVPSMAEHTFNAAVVRYMVPLLQYNGFKTMLTQPLNGRDVSLRTRTNMANAAKADFYYSVHADANPDQNAWGHWGFYWSTSEASKRFAQIWQKHADVVLPNKNPARRIHPSEKGTWSEFAVCRDTTMPAFLGEHAFMTNIGDLALLKNEDFRRACAETGVRALCEYFKRPFQSLASKPVSPPTTPQTPAPAPKPPIKEEDYQMKAADANKIIEILKAVYGIVPDKEVGRLADELRKVSGQPTQNT